jgi:RHS repeat-associated protein
MIHPLSKLAEAIEQQQPAVLATVIEITGASPAKIGAQIVLLADGTTTGNGAVVTPDERMQFTYDHLDRLLSATKTTTDGYSQSYGYNAIGNIISTTMLGTYTYTQSGPNSIRPHAVIAAGNNLYDYDANGNMTRRVEVTATQRITYTQRWDTENRLIQVDNTYYGPCFPPECRLGAITEYHTPTAKFIYDGDGTRVLQVQISGTQIITTAYAGTLEVQITATQRITKTYYSAGSQLIAMRVITSGGNALYFLHGDHLGSTSLTTDSSGSVVARQLYDAWGNLRVKGTGLPTDVGYTGQRFDSYIKLVQMGARWYDPEIGRWLSPDTIVPDPSNPQSLNRFGYVYNNPLKHIDPSGHCVKDDAWCEAYKKYIHDWFGIDLIDGTAVWSADEAKLVYETLSDIAKKFYEVIPYKDSWTLMKAAWEGTRIVRDHNSIFGGAWTSSSGSKSVIYFPDNPSSWSKFTIAEELGHAWDLDGEPFGGLNGGHISWEMPSQVGSGTNYVFPELLKNFLHPQLESSCILAYICWNYQPGPENTAIPLNKWNPV